MKKAPNFKLRDQDNFERTLTEFTGRWLLLYFYPKDNTAGCTVEACSFRDARDAITDLADVIVIGVSADSVRKHKNFANKHNLNFTLLSDPSTETIKAYGAWGHKKLFGHEYDGILRNTYIITPDGYIAKTYEHVNPLTHVKELLHDIAELKATAK